MRDAVSDPRGIATVIEGRRVSSDEVSQDTHTELAVVASAMSPATMIVLAPKA